MSAVVITRDRASQLTAALGRLTALREHHHVIVVDNASVDGTPALVREHFPGVTLVSLRRNWGAAARNLGVRYADTPYVAFSDDDSWWAAGALRHAADLLDAHPRLALVAARVLVGTRESLDPSCSLMAQSPLPEAGLPGPAILGFLACAAIVRRSAFEAVGGFRGGWGVGGEEQLLAVDLAAAGHQLAYVPEIAAHHHPPPRGAAASGRRAETRRNDLWFAWLRRRLSGSVRATASLGFSALADRQARAAFLRALSGAGWAICARRPVSRSIERDLRRLGRQRRLAREA
jgi:GT2 family glycosyltransferase